MGYLPSGDIATLHAFFQGSGWVNLTSEQRFEKLHAPTSIANPTPQGVVNVPFSATDVANTIGSGNLEKIVALPAWDMAIVPLANTPEPKSAAVIGQLNQWTAGAFKIGFLTQSEYDALAAPAAPGTTASASGIYNLTHPDPTWQATVPGPTPRQTLFPNTVWWYANPADPHAGQAVDYITLDDVVAAS